MWVIFRDPHTVFNHLDKTVSQVVEDKDVLAYQTMLKSTQGGYAFDLYPNVYFIQPFLTTASGTEYHARKYRQWEPITTHLVSASSASPESIYALCSRAGSEELTRAVVEETINVSTSLIELREGGTPIGCLFLRDSEIALIGVDLKRKGNRYSKLLVDAAKQVVKGDTIRVHPMNLDVAQKVYAQLGFVHVSDTWMEASTTQYTAPTRQAGQTMSRTL